MTAHVTTDRLIVTRTSRNGRRIGFHAFKNGDEMISVLHELIDMDFDPGHGVTIEAEKERATLDTHNHRRHIGYGGQWIWESVTNDAELDLWHRIKSAHHPGYWRVTNIHPEWIGLEATDAGLPPHARYMMQLMPRLIERAIADGHTWVTHEESRYLVRHDLYQPGHTVHRYSVRNEDLSGLDFGGKESPLSEGE